MRTLRHFLSCLLLPQSQLDKRQAAERKGLRKLIRSEEQRLLDAQMRERTIHLDSAVLKAEVWVCPFCF